MGLLPSAHPRVLKELATTAPNPAPQSRRAPPVFPVGLDVGRIGRARHDLFLPDPVPMLSLLIALPTLGQGLASEPLSDSDTVRVTGGGFATHEDAGRTLALGPGWKAFFDAGRIEFHAALGPEAPRNLPLTLELESIHRGGVRLEGLGRPAARRENARVSFDRIDGLVERYEVSEAGLELCLDFPTEFGAAGDLVVRYDVASEMTPSALGNLGRLSLRSQHGGVAIGSVTGIDADGASSPGRMRFDGEHLDLILPAAFVDRAAWPLTLDPLIGPEFEVSPSGQSSTSPAIGFEAGSDDYLVAWVVPFSASDRDVRARRVDRFTNQLGSAILPIESASNTLAFSPTVGSSRVANKWLVAWSQTSGLFQPGRVRMRSVNPVGNALSSIIEPADIGTSQSSPALCSDPTLIDDDVILVWTNDGVDVRLAQVQLGAAEPLLFGERIVVQEPTADMTQVSRSLGEGHRMLVAWTQEIAEHGGNRDVFAIGFNGQTLEGTPVLRVTNTSTKDDTWPKCDGDGRRWRVACESDFQPGDPLGKRRVDLRDVELRDDGTLQLVNYFGIPVSNGDYRPAIVHTGAATSVAMGRIDSDNELSCRIQLGGGIGIGGSVYDSFDSALSTILVPVAVGAVDDGILSNSPDARVAWADGAGEIQLGLIDVTSNIQVLTNACGSQGVARAGLPYGGYTMDLDLTGALPGLPAFCALGFQRADFFCGSCVLVPDLAGGGVFQLRTTDAGGFARVVVEVPTDSALIGFETYYQWFTASAAPQCPTFGIDTTRALKLTVF